MIPSGKLNHLLEFQKPNEKKDNTGSPYTEYETDFSCWGNIKANAGQQVFQSAKYDEKIDGLIKIRYRNSVDAEYRIKDKITGQIYQIKGAYDPNGEGEELHIVISEVT